jgi:shikimate dehydrogenase
MKAAVLGSPIAHSLSPFLHRAAYAALGLDDWSYSLVECSSEGLAAFIDGLDADWAGLSLTMPLKRTVLPMLDHVDPVAARSGGANTAVFGVDGRYGYNTDVQGIIEALAEAGAPVPGSVTILGGGATACSALAAVRELGAGAATVVVRDPSRALDLLGAASRLDVRVTFRDFSQLADDAPGDLLISTVPAGVADSYAEQIRSAGVAPATVMDVVYHPWPTTLAQAATAAGSIVASGFAMLLHQAAAQVELMTGKPAPLAAMRAAAEAELAHRAAAESLGAAAGSLRGFSSRPTRLPRALDQVGAACVATLPQAVDHASDVSDGPVLAELRLGLDAGDQQLDADDGAQLALDVGTWRVVHRPWARITGLVLGGEAADDRLGPRGVVVDDQLTVHVRGHVVPRRHHAAMLGLGHVERGRDVRVRAAHDRQRLAARGQLPLGVVAREVPVQGPELAVLARRHVGERQHGRHQALVRQRHQVGRAVPDQELAGRRLINREVRGNVHMVTSFPLPG